MPDAVVLGTVCVAPRARSANRRVYFLELQGDDDTRHHVLCKATMLGGLLPDEATVPFAMHTVCHAPRTTPITYHARPRTHQTRAPHTYHASAMHRWRCTGTCGRETRWPSKWAGESCAPLPPDRDCGPIHAMEAAFLSIRCAGKGAHGPILILHATHVNIASISVDMRICESGINTGASLLRTVHAMRRRAASCPGAARARTRSEGRRTVC